MLIYRLGGALLYQQLYKSGVNTFALHMDNPPFEDEWSHKLARFQRSLPA